MEDQELKWWHVRWGLAGRAISRFAIVCGKIIGPLCLVAAICLGIIYLISPYLGSERMGKVDPRLRITPVNLPSQSEAPLSNASIDCYGYRLLLPNKEVARTFKGDQVTMVRFGNGGWLLIQNTSQNQGIFSFVNSDKGAERFLGREVIRSRFKLMQAAMSATPEQAKWWRFRSSENERIQYLLVTKFSALTRASSPHAFTLGPIYAIAEGGYHGFQLGRADVPRYDVHLDLFDGADRYFAFDITGPEGHGQVLTQEEINAMVASIRPSSGH